MRSAPCSSKSNGKGPTSAGLGIGLSIVRSLAELQGGRAWAESEGPGRGSWFFVELPLRPALPAQGAEQPLARGKGKVLVVEDNPDARQLLAMSLTDLGFSVQGFDSAEAALEALPHLAPDIMVADIGLPGMDGVELLLRSRQLPGLSDLPAIAATAWGQPEDALRIRQAGFDDHFVKPFDVQELVTGSASGSPRGKEALALGRRLSTDRALRSAEPALPR
jgi:CheY-like chemotaxis protein